MFLDREKVRIVAVAGIHGAVKNGYYRNIEKLLRGLLGVFPVGTADRLVRFATNITDLVRSWLLCTV
jgi:hypothetical protein